MVTACCTTLPSMMVSTTSRRLACLANWYSPYLSSPRALSTSTPPMKTQGWSMTPSRSSRSAMSRMPSPRGMLTTLSCGERPGRFEALLADVKRAADGDRDQDQHGEDRIADDHQRMAHALASGGWAAARAPARARRADCAAACRWPAAATGAAPAAVAAPLAARPCGGSELTRRAPAIGTAKVTFDTLQFGRQPRRNRKSSAAFAR